ncbi:urease accessory protein UreG [Haloterrigena turkmenica DSM 5511]|uniref:Urease accessory protein UreG n=1 Tax=Haloterrigena turkmenica (strain ATCC 51198 / DSM 5511 / JCM 9101 / NCIMB 13204 / VKM B-1734 / 4k) TaxID=543526 RepID=D2RQW1_HALTV|nr:urease accessory protein UreG [Haloterrigena turkmenica]ADB60442.1 urease accessory protein UreG [Haloterrigena turkmenica DSM 5511]
MGYRDVAKVGLGGPVGSGKTALVKRLVPELVERDYEVGVIANDIMTQEDADVFRETFADLLPADLVEGVETGACPHTGIREDPSMNLAAVDEFTERHPELDIVLIESGGDNLAATFNPELADYFLFVISVAEGEDIPRKRGPGVTQADLLVVNKTDLAPHVDADLDVIEADASEVRGDDPFVFTDCKDAEGIDAVLEHVEQEVLFA